MNRTKLPSIFAVLFLVAGIAASVLTVIYKKEFRTNANVDIAPKNVRIANVTDSSFSVSWMTQKATTGFLEYKKAGETNRVELDKIENDSTHFVEIKNLDPLTQYSFSIGSRNEIYDNNGTPWQIKTGQKIASNTESSMFATGTVTDNQGNPIKNALVYLTGQSSSVLSTFTSEKGVWILNLSDLKNLSLESGFEILPNSILEISVQKDLESSTAKVGVKNSNPVPTMSMGETYDFRNTPEVSNSTLPSANLDLPKETTPESELK